jgi:putative ABC transport system ATP-binding protein
VRFLDHDLKTDDPKALTEFRRDHVGFVFQFYNLIPSLGMADRVIRMRSGTIASITRNPTRLSPRELSC